MQLQQICLGRTIDILWAFVDASAHASVRGAASVEGAKPRGNVLREKLPNSFEVTDGSVVQRLLKLFVQC